jgi:hypothetical protein
MDAAVASGIFTSTSRLKPAGDLKLAEKLTDGFGGLGGECEMNER